jgi:hypothetical protein
MDNNITAMNNDVNDINKVTKNLENLMTQINGVMPMIDNINKTADKVNQLKQNNVNADTNINKSTLITKNNKNYFMIGGFRATGFMSVIFLLFMTIVALIDYISNSNVKGLYELLPYWGILMAISFGGNGLINYIKNKYI